MRAVYLILPSSKILSIYLKELSTSLYSQRKKLTGHWLNWKDERFSYKEEPVYYYVNKKQETKEANKFSNLVN